MLLAKAVFYYRRCAVAGLLLLAGCEQPSPPEAVQKPPLTPAVPAEPVPAGKEDVPPSPVSPPARQKTLKSLDLQLDERPLSPVPVFGAAPDSGWLDQGQETRLQDTEEAVLLPDLFEPPASEKPIDIKGRMLLDEHAHDLSSPVDGAEISVEIRTGR